MTSCKCVFLPNYGKNACSFSHTCMKYRDLCRSKRSSAFFVRGVVPRTFLCSKYGGILMGKKMHCPKCKEREIQCLMTNETFVSSGGYSAGKGCLGFLLFGPLGLLCGACGSKQKITSENNQKTVWVCKGCGHQFRCCDDVDAELNQLKQEMASDRNLFLPTLLIAVAAVCATGFVAKTYPGLIIRLAFLFGVMVTCIFVLCALAARMKKKRRLEELEDESRYLQREGYYEE